ncbi:MAG: hypothetical protein KAI66_24515, partial [Lentisphaeria bacterium]|nr:hypothetical protein [Lentisphaeria bacterium]
DSAANSLARREIEIAEEALAAVLSGKLSQSALSTMDVYRISEAIREFAEPKGLTPLATFFTAWLQLPASFVSTPTGFSLLLHIPMVHQGSEMNIFRKENLPLPMSAEYNLEIDSHYDYLAVSADGQRFRALSRADLEDCTKIGDFYACVRGNVARKPPKGDAWTMPGKDPEVCIWALYSQEYDLAKRRCDMHVSARINAVRQLSPGTFVVSTNDAHQGRISCRDHGNETRRTFSAGRTTTITLQPGCLAETDSHAFAGVDSGFSRSTDDWTVSFTWPEMAHKLSGGLDIETFHALKQNTDLLISEMSRVPIGMAEKAVGRHARAVTKVGGFKVGTRSPLTSTEHSGTWFPVIWATLAVGISIMASWFARRANKRMRLCEIAVCDMQMKLHRCAVSFPGMFSAFSPDYQHPVPNAAYHRPVAAVYNGPIFTLNDSSTSEENDSSRPRPSSHRPPH